MVVHSRDSQACRPVSQQSEAGAHEGRRCSDSSLPTRPMGMNATWGSSAIRRALSSLTSATSILDQNLCFPLTDGASKGTPLPPQRLARPGPSWRGVDITPKRELAALAFAGGKEAAFPPVQDMYKHAQGDDPGRWHPTHGESGGSLAAPATCEAARHRSAPRFKWPGPLSPRPQRRGLLA